MKVFYDKDADLSQVRGLRVAVLGYGSQGSAQSRNLRDSGCNVVIGLRPGSPSAERAKADGFQVLPTAEAVAASDLVMMLVPDEKAPKIYQESVGPNLKPGAFLAFSHGFGVHFKYIQPPANINVFLVAPKSPGHLVRTEYERGAGVPCLLAVEQDPSGTTRAVGMAYASAIGGGRAGIIETTFREETETDLFGEQAVLCGGVSALIQAGYETLVEAGYAPEMAYFECLHEMKLIVDLFYKGGISNMRHEVSNTAQYGDLTRGPRLITPEVRATMKQVLNEIQSGAFAREWMGDHDSGGKKFRELAEKGDQHPIEAVGRKLRAMMPFLQNPAAKAVQPKAAAAPEPAGATGR
ncbi:MAG TPA: ketol-acid reductoisomerase [Terriglobales bacterium]|nr:ketol-acid reductoisomerase [Terriglobales bacterium]